MLQVEMLPAGNGDALWIEYAAAGEPRRRVLVDGGTQASWEGGLRARLERAPPGERHFELVIVSHVDADHIDGALDLLRSQELSATYGDVWFNGWRHLPDTPLESLGPVAGERLTDVLVNGNVPWNAAFGGRAVVVPPEGDLPSRELAGGLKLTLLSPRAEQLARLKPVWRKVVEEAGLDPDRPREPEAVAPAAGPLETLGTSAVPDVPTLAESRFTSDTAEANGSSIAVLLELEGGSEEERRSIILGADAFPGVVAASLERLAVEREVDRIAVDALKLPHHGSRANVSIPLLERAGTPRYLFSSNGVNTRHPHPEAVARVLRTAQRGATLYFNYDTSYTEPWRAPQLVEDYGYEAVYPDGPPGLTVAV